MDTNWIVEVVVRSNRVEFGSLLVLLERAKFYRFPRVGEVCLIVFYNEGMRRLFYVGVCVSYSGSVFDFVRRSDESLVKINFFSPGLVGCWVILSRSIVHGGVAERFKALHC